MQRSLTKATCVFVATSLIVLPARTLKGPRPFDEWVISIEKYQLRKTPGSFPLIGYVYGDRNIGKESERRKPHECFSMDFLATLKDSNHKEDLSPEDVLKAKNRSLDLSTFLKIGKKVGEQREMGDVEATLKKEGVEIVVLEIKGAFKQSFSSGEIVDNVSPKCREEVLDPKNWVVTKALGVSSTDYFFARSDGTQVSVSSNVRDLLKAKLGFTQDELEIRQLKFDEPRYVGFVGEHWNSKRKQFER